MTSIQPFVSDLLTITSNEEKYILYFRQNRKCPASLLKYINVFSILHVDIVLPISKIFNGTKLAPSLDEALFLSMKE